MLSEETKQKLEKLNEIDIYFMIDSCGAFIWRMTHDMSHGRISDTVGVSKEIEEVKVIQEFAAQQLLKFGIDPATRSDRPNGQYWKWYNFWNNWHKNELSEKQWNIISNKMEKEEDYSEFYLKKMRYVKLMKLNGTPLW